MIALSCGIKISAVRHLVLSQSTRVTDRQTGGQTDRITTPKTALAYARAVKIDGLVADSTTSRYFSTTSDTNTIVKLLMNSYLRRDDVGVNTGL